MTDAVAELQEKSKLIVQKRFGVDATVYVIRAEGRFGPVVAAARQPHDRGTPLQIMSPDRQVTATMYALTQRFTGTHHDYAVDAVDGTRIGIVHPVVLQADTGISSRWEIQQVGEMPLSGTDHTSFGVVRNQYADYVIGGNFKVARSALPFDFRFGQDGRALRIRRKAGLRDRYVLEIAAAAVDRRLAIAQTVALSVFEEQNLMNSWKVTRRLFTGR